jgi:hypothetical protein
MKMPLRRLAANLSLILSPASSRSNCANESRMFSVILREAGIEERVDAALQKLDLPLPEKLSAVVQAALADQPAASWRAAVEQVASQLLAAQDQADAVLEGGT